MRKYTLVVLSVLVCLLSSCDSSSSPASAQQQDDDASADRDADGLRDDVQSAIADRYPNEQRKREALRQLALGIQQSLDATASDDVNDINAAYKSVIDATDCITAVSTNSLEDLILIEALMIDSAEKSEAYDEFNTQASGQFFGGTTNFEDGCR